MDSNKTHEFTCAICYTNGEKTGIVIPKCCSHKICLGCYTNIVLTNKEKSKCPECRAIYMPKTELIVKPDTSFSYYWPTYMPTTQYVQNQPTYTLTPTPSFDIIYSDLLFTSE